MIKQTILSAMLLSVVSVVIWADEIASVSTSDIANPSAIAKIGDAYMLARTEAPWTVSLSASIYSKYLGADGEVLDPQPVVQYYVALTHISGIYGSAWINNGLEGSVRRCSGDSPCLETFASSDEGDWTVGWSGETGPIIVDCGIAYYDLQYFGTHHERLYDADSGLYYDNKPTCYLAPFLAVSKEIDWVGTLEPYMRAESGYPTTKSDTDGGGFMATLGCRHNFSLDDGVSLRTDTGLTLDDGIYGFQKNTILFTKVCLDLDYEYVALGPELQIYHTCRHLGERADQQTNVALGFSVSAEF